MQAGDPRALSRAVFVYPAQNDADEGLEPFLPPANRSSCDSRRGIATLWVFFWLLSSTQQSHGILSVGVVVNENVTCPNRTGPASTRYRRKQCGAAARDSRWDGCSRRICSIHLRGICSTALSTAETMVLRDVISFLLQMGLSEPQAGTN
jgi:hypothetical protein